MAMTLGLRRNLLDFEIEHLTDLPAINDTTLMSGQDHGRKSTTPSKMMGLFC